MPLSKFERWQAMHRELYTERVLADFFLDAPISDDTETPIIMMLGGACDATMGDACDTTPRAPEDHEDEAPVRNLIDEPTTLFLCIVSILWYTIFTVIGIF